MSPWATPIRPRLPPHFRIAPSYAKRPLRFFSGYHPSYPPGALWTLPATHIQNALGYQPCSRARSGAILPKKCANLSSPLYVTQKNFWSFEENGQSLLALVGRKDKSGKPGSADRAFKGQNGFEV